MAKKAKKTIRRRRRTVKRKVRRPRTKVIAKVPIARTIVAADMGAYVVTGTQGGVSPVDKVKTGDVFGALGILAKNMTTKTALKKGLVLAGLEAADMLGINKSFKVGTKRKKLKFAVI